MNYPIWRVIEWTQTDDLRWKVQELSEHFFADLAGALRIQGRWIARSIDDIEDGSRRVKIELTSIPHYMSRLGDARRPSEPSGASRKPPETFGLALRSAYPSAIRGGAINDHLSFDW